MNDRKATEKHTGKKEEKVCKVCPTEPVFKEPAQSYRQGPFGCGGKGNGIGFLQTKTATFTTNRLS